VVPTYCERDALPFLIERLAALKEHCHLELELLIMDDDSQDGSVEFISSCGYDWARIVVRKENKGLSPAVVDGLMLAKYPVIVVMDADLSHPPEKIPHMILALESGQEFVIGSRYVPGASTDDNWGFFRWLNSRIATWLAWPLTSAKDPMAGFFAFRKAELDKAPYLNPIGYKVALEIIVKCKLSNVGEVPIHFSDREHGESKLTLMQQLLYIQHLRRLYMFKFGTWSHFVQFAAVGLSGVAVNLAVLTLLSFLGAHDSVALGGGIVVSVITNFLLNRRFTFSYAREGDIWHQFLGFCAASGIGATTNYAVALYVSLSSPDLPLQISALYGIAAGLIFNFVLNRYLVFRKKRKS